MKARQDEKFWVEPFVIRDRTHPIQDVEFYVRKYKEQGFKGDDLWHKLIEKALTTNTEVDSASGM